MLALAVGVLSAATLAFEILLVRIFSIAQWHHFAFMIISLALLGFGASGTFLAICRRSLLNHVRLAFASCSLAFAASALAATSIALAVPLNLVEIAWDHAQFLNLLMVFLILAVPFFWAASAIGLALTSAGQAAGRIYQGDLIGAGLGALAVVGGLFLLMPATLVKVIALVGVVAAAIATLGPTPVRPKGAAILAVAAALVVIWPNQWLAPTPSPYKELSIALTMPDAETVAEHSSPLGLLSVVRSPTIPFRYVPGFSINAVDEPPDQLAVFVDGSGLTPITRFDGNPSVLRYLDQQTSALPYHLLDHPRVAVLGAGGGADVLLAMFHQSAAIDAIELNSQMVRLVREEFADFAGGMYSAPQVRVQVGEARSHIADTAASYDLIHLALLDSFSAAGTGLHALNESTLYTVEAFGVFLDKLSPGGYLAITRWLKVPPRDSLKLLATAIDALERRGIADAASRLAVIRDWRTSTLIVKNGPLPPDDIEKIRLFSEERAFDLAFYPGIGIDEVNRHNILDQPYLYRGAIALLGTERQRFLDDYAFDVAPSTDDRPYFFHFLKWRTLVELMRMPGRSGLNLIEWGVPVLLATLVQAVTASIVLILLPLAVSRWTVDGDHPPSPRWWRTRIVVYFVALGLAFLFIEMAFIQRFQLFLGHPLYAVAVVICGFLVFAGLGSGFADWTIRRRGTRRRRTITTAIAAIIVLALGYVVLLPTASSLFGALAAPVKVLIALALIAPLAFFMGMPFPVGLVAVTTRTPQLVPWAWGINGCASVISAVLAILVALHIGFSGVVVAAALLYGLAALVVPLGREPGRPSPTPSPR